MIRFVAVILAGFAIATAGGGKAHACSCVAPDSPEAFVERTDIIFEGVPVKFEVIEPKETSDGRFAGLVTLRSLVRVQRVYKGSVSPLVSIESPLNVTACGWKPSGIGQEQMVAANLIDGRYQTSLCHMLPLADQSVANPYVRFIWNLDSHQPK